MYEPSHTTNEILDSISGLCCGARCCDHRNGRVSLFAFPVGEGLQNIPALLGAVRKTVAKYGIGAFGRISKPR